MIYKSIFTLLIIIFSYNFSWAYSFDDEFSGSSIDTTAWAVMDREGDTSNSEQECYHPANVTESGGYANITEQSQTIACTGTSTTYHYTSGMIQWKSFNFTYGQIDVRAKLAGDWPAIWMLGYNCQATNVNSADNVPPCSWPNAGSEEIDIAEVNGGNTGYVYRNFYATGYSGSQCGTSVDTTGWHVYTLIWSAGSLTFQIDGSNTCTITDSHVPSTPMFLIINVARSASWQGGSLPATSQIDYVRVTSAGPPDTQPPTTPTNLSASAVSSSQINLTWTASTDNVGVTGYKIYRCVGSGCTPSSQLTTAPGTSYSDTGLSPSTVYVYAVSAYDAAGNESAKSSSASATTQSDSIPPTPPTNLSALAVSSSQINLTWTASTDNVGVTGYQVQRCQGAGCTSFAQIATVTGTTYNNTGLSAGTGYSYRVRATDAAGNLSGFSNIAAVTTLDTTPPTAPSNLVATVASSSQINLTWTASTDNVAVTGYQVESCQGAGCTSFAQIATVTGTTYNNTGLSAGTSYSYRVRATDAAGNLSAYSNIASATTPDTTAPTAPSNLTASAVSETQVNLAWTASTDNVGVTGYQVQRCQGASCTSFSQVGTATGTAYSDKGLLARTSYRYRVRATDAAGNLSGFSNIAAVTTLDTTPPTAPSNLVATVASSSQIKLTWTASTDNVGVTGYKIYRCVGSGCAPSSQLTTAAGTSYSDTGLSPSTVYVYAVSAYDAAGNESAKSSSASATTQPDSTRPAAPTHLMIQ